MKSAFEFTESDAQLINSPRFDALAGLFADVRIYGKLVNYGYGELGIPVIRKSGEIDNRARVIPLQNPKATVGEYALTRDTISKITRRHLGKIAIPADEIEILRTMDTATIQAMRDEIHGLVKQNDEVFGRSLFVV